MSIKLIPCPFCGDNNPREVKDDNYTWCTNQKCPICDIEITKKEWNIRQPIFDPDNTEITSV